MIPFPVFALLVAFAQVAPDDGPAREHGSTMALGSLRRLSLEAEAIELVRVAWHDPGSHRIGLTRLRALDGGDELTAADTEAVHCAWGRRCRRQTRSPGATAVAWFLPPDEHCSALGGARRVTLSDVEGVPHVVDAVAELVAIEGAAKLPEERVERLVDWSFRLASQETTRVDGLEVLREVLVETSVPLDDARLSRLVDMLLTHDPGAPAPSEDDSPPGEVHLLLRLLEEHRDPRLNHWASTRLAVSCADPATFDGSPVVGDLLRLLASQSDEPTVAAAVEAFARLPRTGSRDARRRLALRVLDAITRGLELGVDQPVTWALSGRLVDADDRPVADSEVSAHAGGPATTPTTRTTTDADGRFTLRVPAGRWVVRTRRPGYAPLHLPPGRPFATDVEHVDVALGDLVLVEGARITGTAGPPDGTPAVGVRVALGPISGHTTTTDVHGAFTFDDLVPGAYTVSTGAERVRVEVGAGRSTTLEIDAVVR